MCTFCEDIRYVNDPSVEEYTAKAKAAGIELDVYGCPDEDQYLVPASEMDALYDLGDEQGPEAAYARAKEVGVIFMYRRA